MLSRLFWHPEDFYLALPPDAPMELSKEEAKLYMIRRTVFQMLRDRNYSVLDSEVNMSKQEFKAKFGENMKRKDLTIQKSNKEDPSDKIYVFFRDDAKLGVSTVKAIKDLIVGEGVYRAIIVVQNEIKSKARSELNLFSEVRIEAFLVIIYPFTLTPKSLLS